MVETRRLDQLATEIDSIVSFPDGDAVIALSGGPDSAGLALVAQRAGAAARAIHIDHGTRHAPLLRHAAVDIAAKLGMEIEVLTVELDGAFSEDKARTARYRALLAALLPGEWALTAHTREDQAETVLLNLIRGAGPDGLSGILEISDRHIARPLLKVSRAAVREMVILAGLPFVDDPTNADVGFTRNALRLHVIPEMEARFNPQLGAALIRTAELVGRDNVYMEGQAAMAPTAAGADGMSVPRSFLLTVPRPIADRVVRRMVTTLRPPYGPSFREMGQIWLVIQGEAGAAELGDGLVVTVDGPVLSIRRAVETLKGPVTVDLGPGTTRVGPWLIEIAAFPGACPVFPVSLLGAVFPPETELTAAWDPDRGLVVSADGAQAWIPGRRRFPVGFYTAGTSGYLSAFATEEPEWT